MVFSAWNDLLESGLGKTLLWTGVRVYAQAHFEKIDPSSSVNFISTGHCEIYAKPFNAS